MKCSKCENSAVYKLPNMYLCKDHFIEHFEKKVDKTFKKFKLLNKDDKVCVATSGGKDSLAVLYTTAKFCRKNNIEFFALAIDEGIKGYRDHTLDDLNDFCKNHDVDFKVVSFKEVLGDTLDNITKKAMEEFNKKPCTVCGIFRRVLLNRTAKAMGATKLVTGHNLDDEAQAYLMNLLLGNMSHNASLGPITGLNSTANFVPRIKPLYFISEKETRLFAYLKEFKVNFSECPNIEHSFRAEVRNKLNELETVRTGAKAGIINSFLEILPDLKEKYKVKKTFSTCNSCGDPCSGDICNACKMVEELDLKWNLDVKLQ